MLWARLSVQSAWSHVHSLHQTEQQQGEDEIVLLQTKGSDKIEELKDTAHEDCDWQCYLDRYPGLAKECSKGKIIKRLWLKFNIFFPVLP